MCGLVTAHTGLVVYWKSVYFRNRRPLPLNMATQAWRALFGGGNSAHITSPSHTSIVRAAISQFIGDPCVQCNSEHSQQSYDASFCVHNPFGEPIPLSSASHHALRAHVAHRLICLGIPSPLRLLYSRASASTPRNFTSPATPELATQCPVRCSPAHSPKCYARVLLLKFASQAGTP